MVSKLRNSDTRCEKYSRPAQLPFSIDHLETYVLFDPRNEKRLRTPNLEKNCVIDISPNYHTDGVALDVYQVESVREHNKSGHPYRYITPYSIGVTM
jgi:hypothetical protein